MERNIPNVNTIAESDQSRAAQRLAISSHEPAVRRIKTYPRPPTRPYTPHIPARHKGRGKLERLTRGRERFPGEPSCVPLRTPAQGRSPHIPGRAIEAVRAWQQAARTPFGSGRSNYRAAVADGPGTMARTCGLGPKLAAVVSAPSAMETLRAGAERLP
jgi:hypothetical protein